MNIKRSAIREQPIKMADMDDTKIYTNKPPIGESPHYYTSNHGFIIEYCEHWPFPECYTLDETVEDEIVYEVTDNVIITISNF